MPSRCVHTGQLATDSAGLPLSTPHPTHTRTHPVLSHVTTPTPWAPAGAPRSACPSPRPARQRPRRSQAKAAGPTLSLSPARLASPRTRRERQMAGLRPRPPRRTLSRQPLGGNLCSRAQRGPCSIQEDTRHSFNHCFRSLFNYLLPGAGKTRRPPPRLQVTGLTLAL